MICESGGLSKSWVVYSVLEAVNAFCKVNQLTPSKMVKLLKSPEDHDELFGNFLHFLKRRGYTGVTIQKYMNGLKVFLKFLDSY